VALVLREAGIEAVGLRAKGLMEVPVDEVDVVVNLCAETRLPLLRPSVRRYSWPLPDPSCAPREESLEAFRATRDELLRRLPPLLRELGLLR
jgi:protein-tyrosine-phosphatase